MSEELSAVAEELDEKSLGAVGDLLGRQSVSLLSIADQLAIYVPLGDEQLETKLTELVEDHRESMSALADLLRDAGGEEWMHAVPGDYAHLHYVSIRFVFPILLEELAGLVERYRECLEKLPEKSRARSLVEDLMRRKRDLLAASRASLEAGGGS